MAKSKVKSTPKAAAPPVAPSAKSSAGFYKKNNEGNALHFAPTAVHYPGGSPLVSKKDEYAYPVEGWSYYESAEAA